MLQASLARGRSGEYQDPDAMPVADPATEEATGWQPGPRYADRPMPWSTRFWSASGVGGILLLILVAATFTWHFYAARQVSPSLSVSNLSPPAAPPEPVRDTPAGPEKTDRKAQTVTS